MTQRYSEGLAERARARLSPEVHRYVASGAIRTSGAEFAPRLRQIFDGVLELVREYRPGEVAIERVFMHRNADSALKLGQARGAAICAVFSIATLPKPGLRCWRAGARHICSCRGRVGARASGRGRSTASSRT